MRKLGFVGDGDVVGGLLRRAVEGKRVSRAFWVEEGFEGVVEEIIVANGRRGEKKKDLEERGRSFSVEVRRGLRSHQFKIPKYGGGGDLE